MWFLSPKNTLVTYCEHCGVETGSKRLCNTCNKVHEYDVYHCEGCGEEYPRTHLVYVNTWSGHFCDRCIDGSELE